MKKQLTALVLCICMVLSVLPVIVSQPDIVSDANIACANTARLRSGAGNDGL